MIRVIIGKLDVTIFRFEMSFPTMVSASHFLNARLAFGLLTACLLGFPGAAQAQLIQLLDPPSNLASSGSNSLGPAIGRWQKLQLLGQYGALIADIDATRQKLPSGSYPDGVALAWRAKIARLAGDSTGSARDVAAAQAVFANMAPTPSLAFAALINNQGVAAHAASNFTEASRLYDLALATAQKSSPSSGLALHIEENIALLDAYTRRFADAEVLRRQIQSAWKKLAGPDDPDTIEASLQLATALPPTNANEANALFKGAVAAADTRYSQDLWLKASAHQRYGAFLEQLDRFDEADINFAAAAAAYQAATGHSQSARQSALALVKGYQALLKVRMGLYPEADAAMRDYLLAEQLAFGASSAATAIPLCNMADLFMLEDRFEDARRTYASAAALLASGIGAGTYMQARALVGQGSALLAMDSRLDAEQFLRAGYDMWLKDLGFHHVTDIAAIEPLARLYVRDGRLSEAQTLLEGAQRIQDEGLAPGDPARAPILEDLARVEFKQAKIIQARQLAARAYSLLTDKLGPLHPRTSEALELQASLDVAAGDYDTAVVRFRKACASRKPAQDADVEMAPAWAEDELLGRSCGRQLAFALWQLSRASFDPAHDRRSGEEAFDNAQTATQSSAGTAVSQAEALTVAITDGIGEEAKRFEALLIQKEKLDDAFADAVGTLASTVQTENISVARTKAESEQKLLAARILARSPRYWDYRAPRNVSPRELQGLGSAALLRANEALVFWVAGSGDENGLIFAVNRNRFAWSRIALSAIDLEHKVAQLRQAVDSTSAPPPFPRQVARELYKALLGPPSINEVIETPGIDTLFIVPTGALTSLSPGLLVTGSFGGADDDPASLRSTPWLIRTKALAMLPTVSALRTLRQRAAPSGGRQKPLIAFADPDFGGTGHIPGDVDPPPPCDPAYRAPQPTQIMKGGFVLAEQLAQLPSLYCTLQEARELGRLLHAGRGDIHLGPAADKTSLLALNSSHVLEHTRIVAFATHGLLSGDFSGLTEPALALAHPRSGALTNDDGLLRASEAATLTLNAEWVLLSACNTAGPNDLGGEGLSGLARGFFHAGARALLVSHWRIRDDTAMRIIGETLHDLGADTAERTKAKALQTAMLKVLDDPSDDTTVSGSPGRSFAQPRAWAPFVLVGAPD